MDIIDKDINLGLAGELDNLESHFNGIESVNQSRNGSAYEKRRK